MTFRGKTHWLSVILNARQSIIFWKLKLFFYCGVLIIDWGVAAWGNSRTAADASVYQQQQTTGL